jgi:hypothetical protein
LEQHLQLSLTSPTKPAEKSYQEIIKLLGDHLSPKPLSIAERFRFHKRKQLEGEPINDYVEFRSLTASFAAVSIAKEIAIALFNVKPASDSNFF